MICFFKQIQVPCVLKQILATVASGCLTVTAGFVFGFSAVLLPELKKDARFPYDEDLASWIASISPLSMAIGSLFAGSIIDKLGRKTGHILLAVISLISWLVTAFATNNTLLLIGRFIAGLSTGSNRPVSLVYLGEITDPKYRRFTLIGPSMSLSLGISISHIMGGYVTWRICCFIYAASNVMCLLILLFLRESPLWLISRGKIAEGTESFKWFRGPGKEAEKELQLVLQRQNESKPHYFKEVMNLAFIKPLFTVFLISFIQFSGVNVFSFYGQEMLEVTFKGSIDPFLFMIAIDVIRLIVTILIFVFNKFIPRKIFFLIVNFGCSVVLFVLVIYLLHIDIYGRIWMSVTIIVVYVSFGGAIIALAWSFLPELFPANLRGFGSGMGATMSYTLLFVCVKITPGFMSSYGEIAMYTAYGVIIFIISIIFSFILPETNGRTLQDIADSYKSKTDVSSL